MHCKNMIIFNSNAKPGSRFFLENPFRKMLDRAVRQQAILHVLKEEAKKLPEFFLAEYQGKRRKHAREKNKEKNGCIKTKI